MSDYTKTVDFAAKDSLPSGNSGKIIKGTEFETEFDNIATAIATKANLAGPTFTGVLTFASFKGATGATVTTILDEDDMATNSATALATQQSIKAYVDAQQDTVDTLAEILALGNATGGTDLAVSSGDDITFADNSKAIFGAGSDLQIYHDGSHSYIKDTATGNLRIDGTDIQIRSDAGANMAAFVTGAEVQLYHNNQKKFETTASGIDITGSVTADGLTVNSTNNSGNTGTPTIVLKDLDVTVSAGQFTGAVEFETSDTNNPGVNSYIRSVMTGTGGGGSLKFGTGFAGSLADRVLIGGTGDISFYDDAAAQGLFWDSSASALGLGTTIPGQKLEIKESSTGAGDAIIRLRGDGNNANNTPLGSLEWFNTDSSGPQPGVVAAVEAQSANANGHMGKLLFKTHDGSGSEADPPTTRMTIDESGNVGIGTTAPSGALHVKDSSEFIVNVAGSDSSTEFKSALGNSWRIGNDSSLNAFAITQSANLATDVRLFIANGGNVGIGTSAPSYLMHLEDSNGADLALGNSTASPSEGDYLGRIYALDSGDNFFAGINMFYHDADDGEIRLRVRTAGTNTDVMTLVDGNVGIGSSAPDKLLVVQGASAEVVISDTSDAPLLRFRESGVTKGTISTSSGALIFDSGGDTERMRLDANGNLLVGTTDTTPSTGGFSFLTGAVDYALFSHDSAVASGNYYIGFRHGTNTIGAITQDGTTGVLYNTSSDQRLKENIADADDAGSKIDAIQVRKFDWKADGSHQDYGMVAQELQVVAPEAVSAPEDPDEMMGVDYSKLVPMLVKEIQSLRARVAQLES